MQKEVRNQQKMRQFKKGVDLVHPISDVGDVSFCTVEQEIESADENYYAGMQESKKYTTPAIDLFALIGEKQVTKKLEAEFNQIAIAGIQTEQFIKNGKLSMVDLENTSLWKSGLDTVEGISMFQRCQMEKHRERLYDLLVFKDALETRKKLQEKLDPSFREYLKTSDYFDLRQERINEILTIYFKNSDNEILRNVNPTRMSEKELRKLISSGEKNGFTTSDISALRLTSKQMKYRESRIRVGNRLNIRKYMQLVSYYAENMDSVTGEGVKHVAYSARVTYGTFALGRLGGKAAIVASSVVGRYTGASYAFQKINQIRREKENQMKEAAGVLLKQSKVCKVISEKSVNIKGRMNKAQTQINEMLNQNSTVKQYRSIQKKTSENAKKVAEKANQMKAASKRARRNLKQGKDIVLSPVRIVGNGFGKFVAVINKLRVALLAAAGIIIAFFLIIIVLINSILSLLTIESTSAVSVILTEDENFIINITAVLQNKVDDKKAEAYKIADGKPQNPNVLEGHTISKYGHPDGKGSYSKGSNIVYLDGYGNIILNGMNNIKDAIVMAYVIMEGDFDSNTRARDDLIMDLWNLMNPRVSYKESDIYICANGCAELSYICNDPADYEKIRSYKSDGVGFYGNIKPYSVYGDRYTVTCNGCKDKNGITYYHATRSGTGIANGCSNSFVNYQCNGHGVSVCYGHKDIEVYITVKMIEEMFLTGELPSGLGKSYQNYLKSFEGWTDDNKEWAECLKDTDWYDTYGVDPSGGSGFVTGSSMSSEEIAAIIDKYGDVDTIRKAICSDAMSFVGMIPYYWGGKASMKDFASNGFDTLITADYKGRNKKGLDCSGFVQWIIWRVTDAKLGASTRTITAGMKQISASDLQPGDLGLMSAPGAASNHVGIFVGYNDKGQALWCHENSGSGNVAVNNTTCFRLYYSLF